MVRITPGQRWISEMEPELGLGIVTDVASDSIRILFPASDCERLYALPSAPIKRVQFRENDSVTSRDGISFQITSIKEENGIFVYYGTNQKISEKDLSDAISFTNATDRLLNGFYDDNRYFNIRFRTLNFFHLLKKSQVRGFSGGRIDLIPHQFYVAHEVTSRHLPRVLLSDEVGLGKTIEACLILHRLLTIGRITRVLIVVPQSLVHQWFIELIRRFNLIFRIFDEEYCESVTISDARTNPFLEDQLGICSVDFLTSSNQWRQQAIDAGWDMVVIDEAHHLTEKSIEYQLAEKLSAVTQGLMLLTATPEQLGLPSHFARLHLLDPARYYDYKIFEKEEKNYQNIVDIINKFLDKSLITNDDISILNKILPNNYINVESDRAESSLKDKKNKNQFIENLLDCYGVGRAVFRNTRAAISGFPKRIAHIIPLEKTGDLKNETNEFTADLFNNTDDITYNFTHDPRVSWIVKFLKKNNKEKILLICHSMEKVQAIDDALRKKIKINIALFHENLSLLQRDRNAAWFAKKDGAQILICSEIGSEGRNFQFAHHLVLFDLPMDPELLEQRIGRLDRIGQKENIHIHIPYIKGSESEVMVKWYHEGLNAFEKNVPGVFQIYQKFREQIRTISVNKQISQLKTTIQSTKKICEDIAIQLEKGRDRLLELNSFRPQVADKLIKEVVTIDKDKALEKFMIDVFNMFGIRSDEINYRTYLINLELLTTPEFPVPLHQQNKFVITFDRKTAVSNENIEFLSWDHPTVFGAIDLILGSEKGNCTIAKWQGAESNEFLLEAIYVLECIAPKRLNVERFLPPTPIRVIVNHSFEDCSDLYSERQFSKYLQNVKNSKLFDNPKIKQELFPQMLSICEKMADDRVSNTINKSLQQMKKFLSREVLRLTELKKVNDNISEEEIELYHKEIDQSRKAINSARLRLDSLRWIIKERSDI